MEIAIYLELIIGAICWLVAFVNAVQPEKRFNDFVGVMCMIVSVMVVVAFNEPHVARGLQPDLPLGAYLLTGTLVTIVVGVAIWMATCGLGWLTHAMYVIGSGGVKLAYAAGQKPLTTVSASVEEPVASSDEQPAVLSEPIAGSWMIPEDEITARDQAPPVPERAMQRRRQSFRRTRR